jgi:hypothetical protein
MNARVEMAVGECAVLPSQNEAAGGFGIGDRRHVWHPKCLTNGTSPLPAQYKDPSYGGARGRIAHSVCLINLLMP